MKEVTWAAADDRIYDLSIGIADALPGQDAEHRGVCHRQAVELHMKDQVPAARDAAHRLDDFARAICQVRGWRRATAEKFGENRVRVTNLAAGMWVECRHREGAESGFMSVGRIGEKAFFQPDFIRPTPDFITFRARQCVQGLRKWDRRARLRRLDVRLWLYHHRDRRYIARQRRKREAPVGAL